MNDFGGAVAGYVRSCSGRMTASEAVYERGTTGNAVLVARAGRRKKAAGWAGLRARAT